MDDWIRIDYDRIGTWRKADKVEMDPSGGSVETWRATVSRPAYSFGPKLIQETELYRVKLASLFSSNRRNKPMTASAMQKHDHRMKKKHRYRKANRSGDESHMQT